MFITFSFLQDTLQKLMGRPKPSESAREFAIEFAKIVTVSSESGNDFVARLGIYGIYSVLARLAPKVLSVHHPSALRICCVTHKKLYDYTTNVIILIEFQSVQVCDRDGQTSMDKYVLALLYILISP